MAGQPSLSAKATGISPSDFIFWQSALNSSKVAGTS